MMVALPQGTFAAGFTGEKAIGTVTELLGQGYVLTAGSEAREEKFKDSVGGPGQYMEVDSQRLAGTVYLSKANQVVVCRYFLVTVAAGDRAKSGSGCYLLK
jgi:hypothetical protein